LLEPNFESVSRQQFRRYFQPSRVLICVLPDAKHGWNLITLSFNMWCSYKPPMIAVAVQDINRSYELIQEASEYVLAVPGPSLASETLVFGWESSKTTDKRKATDIKLIPSEKVAVPSVREAIANIEVKKRAVVQSGDHVIVVGEALRFAVNKSRMERNLISIGPDTTGYRVLASQGIHRISVVDAPNPETLPDDDPS
jgi:flavin reductase (DIM6/NTAB) family NADH-FMN oxidoreductase RutF